MLFCLNNQLVFNFEIGKEFSYTMKECAFCTNEFVEDFFKNIKITEKINIDEMQSGTIYALSPNQMLNFIKDWHAHASFHKLFEWTPQDWFNSFWADIKKAHILLEGDIGNDDPFHPQLSLNIVNTTDIKKLSYNEDRFIIFSENNKQMCPEFSWAVEDCLYCRLNNIHSKYSKYVNSIINNNIKKNKYYAIKQNLFGDHARQSQKKTKSFDIMVDEIPKDFVRMLHSPYPGDCVRTSITHLISVLEVANGALR